MKFPARKRVPNQMVGAVVATALFILLSCATQASSGTDSSTHWLSPCRSNGDCGSLDCVCGVCTKRCANTTGCLDLSKVAVCAASEASGCGEPSNVCVASCAKTSDCAAIATGLGCVNGQCVQRGGPAGTGGQPGDASGRTGDGGGTGKDAATDRSGTREAGSDSGTSGGPFLDSAIPTDAGPPVAPSPTECTYLEFRARNGASAYSVPVGEESHCFAFHLDMGGPRQAVAFYPHLGASVVSSHIFLYSTTTPQTDNTNASCVGAYSDSDLIAAWVPGAGPWLFPKDTGIDLGGGDFVLEVHYNNRGTAPVKDASGFEVCSTRTLRPNVASISWLGTDGYSTFSRWTDGTTQTSNCNPSTPQPIRIIEALPSMRVHGLRMTADIHRADGGIASLFDADFSNHQSSVLVTPAILNSEDSIRTTCTYDAQVGFGPSDAEEVCYAWVLASPAHALLGGSTVVTSSPCNN